MTRFFLFTILAGVYVAVTGLIFAPFLGGVTYIQKYYY